MLTFPLFFLPLRNFPIVNAIKTLETIFDCQIIYLNCCDGKAESAVKKATSSV